MLRDFEIIIPKGTVKIVDYGIAFEKLVVHLPQPQVVPVSYTASVLTDAFGRITEWLKSRPVEGKEI